MSVGELRMNALQIRKEAMEAAVRIHGGGLVAGRFFLETPSDAPIVALARLLNTPDRCFFPFVDRSTNDVRFLSREHISVVWPTVMSQGRPSSLDAVAVVPAVTVDFGDATLVGDVLVGDMHPDRRRLVDVLNDPRPFFALRSIERVYLVHKQRIRTAHLDKSRPSGPQPWTHR